ncbi:hypothetical protein ACHWQZ_G005597 [Mnemiopsis leidyi]
MKVDEGSIANHTSLNHVLGDNHGGVKVFLLTYNSLVILLGMFGNSLVLVGSVKYNAIRMEENSVILLEHVAAADVMATLFQFVPMLATLAAERWVLGKFLCYCGILRYIPFCCEAMLIAIMSCHRVRVLACPLSYSTSPRLLKKVLLGVWIFYITSLPCLTGIIPTIKYEPSHLNCSPFDWENTEAISKYLRILRMISGIYLFLPAIITVVANIVILRLAYAGRSIRKSAPGGARSLKAVKTVALICWVYIISYVPSVVLFALPVAGVTEIPHYVNLLNMYILSFNLIANPLIYSFTNRRFALFAKLLFTGKVGRFARLKHNADIIITNNINSMMELK